MLQETERKDVREAGEEIGGKRDFSKGGNREKMANFVTNN